LTAGQAGDAPQAQPLVEGLSAEVVMADAAYDSDAFRTAIAAKGAQAVIPNNPAVAYEGDADTIEATAFRFRSATESLVVFVSFSANPNARKKLQKYDTP
jgi:transposase